MAFNSESPRRQVFETPTREVPLPVASPTPSRPASSGATAIASERSIPVTSTAPFAPPPPVYQPTSAGSSAPMSVPTFARFFKVCISAVILMVAGYFTVKSAYPFLKELAEPGSISAGDPNAAPVTVKMLQQARAVVAKNNANVDHLNNVIGEPSMGDEAGRSLRPLAATVGPVGPNAADFPPLPPPPVVPPPRPKPQIRLEPLAGVVLEDLHVTGVIGGADPRIIIDGVLLNVGDMVDHGRRLRFESIDESRRIIVLGNGQSTIEKRY